MTEEMIEASADDLLATMKRHPWNRQCVCGEDSNVSILKLVYVFEQCSCELASYVHLVERLYHKQCWINQEITREKK